MFHSIAELLETGILGIASSIAEDTSITSAEFRGTLSEYLGGAENFSSQLATAFLSYLQRSGTAADYLSQDQPIDPSEIPRLPGNVSLGAGDVTDSAYIVKVRSSVTVGDEEQFLTQYLGFDDIPSLADITEAAGQNVSADIFASEGSREYLRLASVARQAGRPQAIEINPVAIFRR